MAGGLPEREHLVIRGAAVLTMDALIGELTLADVEVRDGLIVGVGRELPAEGARPIDGTGRIVMPGFVDTHWHAWGTLLRGVIGDGPKSGWFARKGALGPHLRPGDTAAGARLALTEGLAAGITTVHDWAHNVLSADDAEANVAADLGLGLRIHFSWGAPSTTPGLSLQQMAEVVGAAGLDVDEPMDVDAAARLRHAWVPASDGRLTVGINVRGPSRSTAEVYRAEFVAARAYALPIAMHCAGTRAEVARIRQVQVLEAEGLLGADLLLAHGNHLAADDIATLALHGIGVSVSPLSELRLAMGLPQVSELLAAGVGVSFSLDTTAIAASADPFQALRVAVGLEGVRAGDAQRLSPRTALELATLGGARALGLAAVTGSITPGKRADLIVIRADDLNLAPVVDPAVAVVHSAAPANVETVIVDGRLLKAAGRLTAVDPDEVVADAVAALHGVCDRAGLDPRTLVGS
jgi:cytosine/adenosine deaminase-related metal-dependent hydrolase